MQQEKISGRIIWTQYTGLSWKDRGHRESLKTHSLCIIYFYMFNHFVEIPKEFQYNKLKHIMGFFWGGEKLLSLIRECHKKGMSEIRTQSGLLRTLCSHKCIWSRLCCRAGVRKTKTKVGIEEILNFATHPQERTPGSWSIWGIQLPELKSIKFPSSWSPLPLHKLRKFNTKDDCSSCKNV